MNRMVFLSLMATGFWLAAAGPSLAVRVAPAPILGAGPAGLAILAVTGAGYFAVRAYRKRRG